MLKCDISSKHLYPLPVLDQHIFSEQVFTNYSTVTQIHFHIYQKYLCVVFYDRRSQLTFFVSYLGCRIIGYALGDIYMTPYIYENWGRYILKDKITPK